MSQSCVDDVSDGEMEPVEIARCLCSHKTNRTAGSDGLVGVLMRYGGMGVVDLLCQLFSVFGMKR